MQNLMRNIDRSARNLWITQGMISKYDECVKRKNVNRDRNNNHTRLKVKKKTARDKAKKEYLERIWDEMEMQRIV
jgi:hypothetical protein